MPLPFNAFTLLAALFLGGVSAYLAHRRGRNPYSWFFLGFLFGLLGVIALFFIPAGKKKEIPPASPQPEPTPSIQGPQDKFWYYLDPTHQQQGPMSLQALTSAFKQGKISLTTYVWHEELPAWKLLQEFVKE